MRRTEKSGTVDSVRRTYKLCCYSNTFNCGHSVFACYESTLAVHSENPLMVSNLTTGNSGQLKMSAKFRPSQKRRFWIWPPNLFHTPRNPNVAKTENRSSLPCDHEFHCHMIPVTWLFWTPDTISGFQFRDFVLAKTVKKPGQNGA